MCLNIFTGPSYKMKFKKQSKIENWHLIAGPVEVKVVSVRQKSYQNLSAGPVCIAHAATPSLPANNP